MDGNRSKKKKLDDDLGQPEEITDSQILEYLKQTNTINIDKIKSKIKTENEKSNNKPATELIRDKLTTSKQLKTQETKPNNSKEQTIKPNTIINNSYNIQREIENQYEKFTTIKFEGESVHTFKHYFKLSQEIERCQKQTQIKSAYINHLNQLVIKTTEEYKNEITNNWPQNAFLAGIQPIINTKKFHAAIYHVDTELNINDKNLTDMLKTKYEITNAKRIIKKSTNEPLNTVKITFENEAKYKYHTEHGIQIGYTHFKLKKWETNKNIKQCYKCLKLGHNQYTCKYKETKCLRCSETHDEKFSECNKPLKCANCGQNHAACSKKCPKIIEYMENLKQELDSNKIAQNKTKEQFTTGISNISSQIQQISVTQTLINRANMNTISFITEILGKLNEITQSIYENTPLYKNIATKYFGNHLENHIENCITQANANVQITDHNNSSIYSMDQFEESEHEEC